MIKLVPHWERNATNARLLGTLIIYVKQKHLVLMQSLQSQQQQHDGPGPPSEKIRQVCCGGGNSREPGPKPPNAKRNALFFRTMGAGMPAPALTIE